MLRPSQPRWLRILTEASMTRSSVIAAAMMLFTGSVLASTFSLVGSDAGQVLFVEPAVDRKTDGRWVLRSFEQVETLGGVYPHRSARLHYRFDCSSGQMALTEWAFYEGSLGHGRPVWAERMEDVAYYAPRRDSLDGNLIRKVCSQ
jgi:hypothetical protein